MKFFKAKKGIIITAAIALLVIFFIRHIICENNAFYKVPYEKTDISEVIKKQKLSDDDYMLIFRQTGVSPLSSKEIIAENKALLLKELQRLYFKEPSFEKSYIAYPITAEERNVEQSTPLVPLKKGDILVTFNTRTLDWRHGHCGLVLDENGTTLLEHMAIGQTSCLTNAADWGSYPAFAVLRHPDGKISAKAADYAKDHLTDIPYNIFAGIIKKDKTDEEISSSHCSHIVWQAYMAVGEDIDNSGGVIVTPRDIALSQKLQVVQIFGLNPEDYTDRITK